MIIKTQLDRIKNRFTELWNYKIFKATVIIHGFYFILSMVLVLTVLRSSNDFLVYLKVGEVFSNDITDLYNQTNYLWEFRYLPISAIFFVPFYLLGFELGFVVFHIINLILNVLICIILYKIISLIKYEDHEKDDKRVILYICIYLLAIPQMFNYILGQINLYITFLIVLSLYLFIKYDETKWDLIASCILGISIIIKPVTIFILPFLLFIHFNRQTRKFEVNFTRSLIRIIGVLLPSSFNIILFLLYPSLLQDFIEINFTGTNAIDINFSFSITKLITNFCNFYGIPFNQLYIFLGVMIIIGGLGFLIFLISKETQNHIIFGYCYGILIMFLVYFESWDHHLLNIIPLLLIVLFTLSRDSEITKRYIKPSIFFFSFFDLLFMGIYLLLEPIFPFNFESTIFLLLSFYGISIFLLSKNLDKKTS